MKTPIQVLKEYRKDISKQYHLAISPELRHARKVSDELEELKIKAEMDKFQQAIDILLNVKNLTL